MLVGFNKELLLPWNKSGRFLMHPIHPLVPIAETAYRLARREIISINNKEWSKDSKCVFFSPCIYYLVSITYVCDVIQGSISGLAAGGFAAAHSPVDYAVIYHLKKHALNPGFCPTNIAIVSTRPISTVYVSN
jgi:hypothetical protein